MYSKRIYVFTEATYNVTQIAEIVSSDVVLSFFLFGLKLKKYIKINVPKSPGVENSTY